MLLQYTAYVIQVYQFASVHLVIPCIVRLHFLSSVCSFTPPPWCFPPFGIVNRGSPAPAAVSTAGKQGAGLSMAQNE